MSQSKNKFSLGVPGAIIIGAIIIALAVIFVFSGNNSANIGGNSDNNPAEESVDIIDLAKEFDIKAKDLEQCIADDRHADVIAQHMANAQEIGFEGTPHSAVIHYPTDTYVTIRGARPIEQWRALIQALENNEIEPAEDEQAQNVLPVSDRDHTRGSNDPAITIIEYSDIDCPFCGRLHETMLQLLEERDDVQWVYRHMPIAGLHPDAYRKAVATECVYELSNNNSETFWQYIDTLFGV